MTQEKLKLKTNKWIIKKLKYFNYKLRYWHKYLATKCNFKNKNCLNNLKLFGKKSRYYYRKIRQLELLREVKK